MLAIFDVIVKRVAKWLGLMTILTLMIAPVVSAAPVINLRKMQSRAISDARKACKSKEIYIDFGIPLRKCESWNASPCFRQSIARPDVGRCYGHILLDDARYGAINCYKVLKYRTTSTGSLRPIRTQSWKCYKESGGPA